MSLNQISLNTRLSGIYAIYFALVGLFMPYWPLYLSSEKYSPIAIGYLMAILSGSKIIAPNLWGWIADKTGQRLNIIRAGTLLTLLFFIPVFFDLSVWQMAWVMFGFSFFWNAILPQVEALTLDHLKGDTHRYTGVRVWGSIGFILSSLVGGFILESMGVGWLLGLIFFGMMLLALNSYWVSSPEVSIRDKPKQSFFSLFKSFEVWCFMGVCFFMQLSFSPYYTFFSIYLELLGYSKTLIACIWSWGVIAEIAIFYLMSQSKFKFSIRIMVIVSLVMSVFRWWATPNIATDFWLLMLLQITHSVTFAVFHALSIKWAHQLFKSHAGQGQALYSSVGFGLGGAVGAILAGKLWSQENPEWIFYMASCSAFLGLVVYLVYICFDSVGHKKT